MESRTDPRVIAVVVTFNRRELVLRCLDALLGATVCPDHVIVVDNASADGTVTAIRSAHPSTKVTVIQAEDNLGPAEGFERGMVTAAQQASDWIMVLNDDCFVKRDTLQRLLAVAAHAQGRVAIISPVGHGGVVGNLWRHRTVPVRLSHLAGGNTPVDVDLVAFSSVIVRADVVRRFGGPRADYFIMWWEWEYCIRLRRQSYRIVVVPDVEVEHLTLGSSRGVSAWREYYQTRNHLRFVLDRRSVLDGVFWFVRQVKFVTATLLFMDQKATRIRFRILGTADALRGRMGRTVTPRTGVARN